MASAGIPTRTVAVSLLLGVVLRVGSYLDLAEQTKRRRWQHLIHWAKRISRDSFEYGFRQTVSYPTVSSVC